MKTANFNKRFIKIIKREYYEQIIKEFEAITSSGAEYLRRVI